MFIQRSINNVSLTFREYPGQFWTLILAAFIDRLGGALLFPFLTLYVTRRFGVGITDVGILFGIFAATSLVGNVFGGALTDLLGRKIIVILGLVLSGLSSVALGLVDEFTAFIGIVVFIGLFADMAMPAQEAMVADLLPPEKRAQGYGILRVVINLAVTFGPAIGGLLASKSYMLLFVGDAVTSIITAVIIALALRETKPVTSEGDRSSQSILKTFVGYGSIFRDVTFILFLGVFMLQALMYLQMNTTLGVFLRDVHGVPEQGFGLILSLNALMVVVFQFPITRWIDKYRPMVVMALGTLLYAIGFAMYGFVSVYSLFLLAMVIITIGEMLVAPVSQAAVAHLAPEDKRGRYMATFGFAWIIPWGCGVFLAGLIMDNYDPRWVWYAAGMIGTLSAIGFFLLRGRYDRRINQSPN